jgi:predicted TIM-barrel fold metal-dependent hydrolase
VANSPWGSIALHDAHIHFFSHRFFSLLGVQKGIASDEVARLTGMEIPAESPTELAARWVAELDRCGVERGAMIASLPGDEESVVEAVQAFPNRFAGYFMANPLAPAAVARAEQVFDAGLRGLCLFPSMHGYSLGDTGVREILAAAAAQSAVVFVHCGVLSIGIRKKLGLPASFDTRYSNPIEVQSLAMQFPQLNFVIPHFGSGFFREALMVGSVCPNVHFDTSSSNSWMRFEGLDLRTVLARTLDVLGPSRMLFGSDSSFFPRGWVKGVFEQQAAVLHDLGISEQDAQGIFSGNFDRLFGLPGES